jgi:hypothetical protein
MKSKSFKPVFDNLEGKESTAAFFSPFVPLSAPITTFSYPVTTFTEPVVTFNPIIPVSVPVTTFATPVIIPATPITSFNNFSLSPFSPFVSTTFASPFYPYGIVSSNNAGLTLFGPSPSFSTLSGFISVF